MLKPLPRWQGSSSLTVFVKDSEELVVPDVEVKLLNKSKKILKTDITSNEGKIIFDNLKNGDYYIRINKQIGYKVFTDQPVSIDNDAEITVTLENE